MVLMNNILGSFTLSFKNSGDPFIHTVNNFVNFLRTKAQDWVSFTRDDSSLKVSLVIFFCNASFFSRMVAYGKSFQ